jgi:hypothetical protein
MMQPSDRCDLIITEEQIGNAKVSSPDVLDALCVHAKAVIDKGGSVCITRAGVIVKRITTHAGLAELCSTVKSN